MEPTAPQSAPVQPPAPQPVIIPPAPATPPATPPTAPEVPKNEMMGRIVFFVFLAVVLIAFYYFTRPEKAVAPAGEQDLTPTSTAETTATSTATSTTATTTKPATTNKTTTTKPATAATQSYVDALAQYKNGYRMQFLNCQPDPNALVLKKGVKFMLDNRDKVAHTIKIGTKSYYIKAYGFAIVSSYTLGESKITCDGRNAGKITVES